MKGERRLLLQITVNQGARQQQTVQEQQQQQQQTKGPGPGDSGNGDRKKDTHTHYHHQTDKQTEAAAYGVRWGSVLVAADVGAPRAAAVSQFQSAKRDPVVSFSPSSFS